MAKYEVAKPLLVSEWLYSDKDYTLEDFRGRVVLIEVFQMLCPSCMSHGLPQALRVRELFDEKDVVVIGLHSIFKRHEEQTPDKLQTFLRNQNINMTFPVAIDEWAPGEQNSATLRSYGMRGTPTQILLDRDGNLRKQTFGFDPDLKLGAEIMSLLRDKETGLQYTEGKNADSQNMVSKSAPAIADPDSEEQASTSEGVCEIPQ